MRRVVVLLAVVAFVGGCRDDGSPTVGGKGSTSSSSTSSTSSSAGTDSTPSTKGTPDSTSACPVSVEKKTAPAVATRALHTALRAAHQPAFDRVVFEFTGAAPGYVVEYVSKPVHEDGSGNEVNVRGQFALQVRMENASGYDFDRGAQSYTGPNRIRPADTTVVEELVRTGDFEGVLTWTIGVKSKAGFQVAQLANPPRLQVEVCAAP